MVARHVINYRFSGKVCHSAPTIAAYSATNHGVMGLTKVMLLLNMLRANIRVIWRYVRALFVPYGRECIGGMSMRSAQAIDKKPTQ